MSESLSFPRAVASKSQNARWQNRKQYNKSKSDPKTRFLSREMIRKDRHDGCSCCRSLIKASITSSLPRCALGSRARALGSHARKICVEKKKESGGKAEVPWRRQRVCLRDRHGSPAEFLIPRKEVVA